MTAFPSVLPTIIMGFLYLPENEKIMKKGLILVINTLLIFFSASCQNNAEKASGTSEEKSTQYTVLSQEDFRVRLADTDDYLLLDVRTPEEYAEGHIANAVNIDFLNPSAFDQEVAKLDKNKTVMIYCRSGNRSGKASKKLKALGFREIYDLDGGFSEWEE